jgi:RecA/RadA recombinase
MASKKNTEAVVVPPRSPDKASLLDFLAKNKVQSARSVLRVVRSVPTVLPYFDWASGVGGFPLERITLIHGPSSHGKTTAAHLLGLSFLKRGHFYCFVDAEMTTSITWLETLMGEHADNPRFIATRPSSYEETVDLVKSTCAMVVEARKTGVVPPDTSCIFVIDSIKKLVPKRLMEALEKDKGGIDGMSGRAAMYRAALNAAWMDSLIPLMAESGCSIVLIARESENTDKQGLYDADWKLTGGKAVFYDSSLVIRITRASWVKEGSGEDANVIGEKHRMLIYKSKIANKEDKTVSAFFHTSNGALVPEGLDHARDVLELADKFGVIEKAGAWLNWGEHKWNGMNKAVVDLTSKPILLDELEAKVRSCFASNELEPELE